MSIGIKYLITTPVVMHDPKILVVDDQRQLTEMYVSWLSDSYEVDKACDGQEALDTVDDSFDIILLDRRLGDMQGGDVLDQIKDRDIDCSVVMLTAYDPDEDIITKDFDAYVKKPVDKEALNDTIQTIQDRAEYNDRVRELIKIKNRIQVLETAMDDDRRDSSPFYQELCDYADDLEQELDTASDEFDHLLLSPDELA